MYYEVLGAGPLRTRFQVAARRGLTRFVGRHPELDQMQHALDQAKAGHGQIVGVMGEPGLGKSVDMPRKCPLCRPKNTIKSKVSSCGHCLFQYFSITNSTSWAARMDSGMDVTFCSCETNSRKGMAMADKIRVGIIGANPDRSWALRAHIPALASLPQYTLQAVSTSRQESADAAAEKFNAPLAFDNHEELVAHPDVDLVVVSVKVPFHHELVLAALGAGKAVFCEWPLGNGLQEAVEMAELVRQKKVCTAVGLQARFAPVINRVRDLVAQGYVGKVLSTSVVGSGLAYGEFVERPNAYLIDKTNGANLLTIASGHFLDAMCYCLGEFEQLSATLATRRPQVKIAKTDESLPATSPDQVAVNGILQGGAVASFHFRGGQSRGTNLLWEINGTDGDLLITGAGGHVQMLELTLQGGQGKEAALAPLAIPDEYRWVPAETPSGFPFNVAQLYVRLASDMQKGTSLSLNFDAAVVRHRMIAAIQKAADTGGRQSYQA